MARCPAHDDKKPSLSIACGTQGIVVKCHAGCSTEQICIHLGIDVAELFYQEGKPNGHGGKIEKIYSYPGENGQELSQLVRFIPKSFCWRHRVNGKWVWNVEGVRRVLYHLPEVNRSSGPIYIFEGEKDVDNARTLGLVATCNPGGAGKWRPEYSETLRGKAVVIFADADPAGREHADKVARSLASFNAPSIKLLEFKGAKDLSEWLANGGNKADLLKLVAEAPEWKPEGAKSGAKVYQTIPPKQDFGPWNDSSPIGMKFETNQSAAQKLPFRTAKQIADETPDKVEWIAKPYVVLGGITEVDGKVKLAGKSTWTTHLCRAALDGLPFMGEPTMRTPIVYLTEQPPSSWRLTLERAGLLGREDFHCLYFKDIRGIMWPVVADEAVAHCRNVGAKLLVVDTLGQFAGITGDNENNTGDALVAMGPLQEAAGNGIAVIILRHDRKSGGLVGESGRGSSAYSGAVDIVLSIRRPEGHTKKTLRTIHAIGRFDDTPEELVIDLTPTGYVPLGTFANVAEAEAEKVLLSAAPRTEEEAASVEELIKGTEVARATAHRVVKSLCNRDKLFGVGKGKKGDPFRYFLTKKDSSQTSNTGETNETNPSGEQNVIPFDAPETALDPEREQGTPKVIPPETRAPSGKGVSFETFEAILGPFVKPKPSRGQNAQPPKKPVSKSEVEQSGSEEEL